MSEATPPGTPPRSVGEIVSASLAVYRRRFATLTLCALAVAVPVALLGQLLAPDAGTSPMDTTSFGDPSTGLGWRLLAAALASVVLSAVGVAACVWVISEDSAGRAADWRTSLAFGLRHGGRLVVLSLLVILCVALGFAALVLPAIWIGVALSVSTAALVLERRSPTAAMRRSIELVRGNWWRSFGALLFLGLLYILLGAVVSIVAGVAIDATGDSGTRATIRTVADAAGTTLTLPLASAVTTLLFFDLRARKEGRDARAPAAGESGEERFGGFAPPLPPSAPAGPERPASPPGGAVPGGS